MKIKYSLFCFAAIAVFLLGCSEDFLVQENPNQPTITQFWRNESDAQAAINATYAPLNFQYRYGFFEYGWGPENWRGDDMVYGGEYPAFSQIAKYINTPEIYELQEFFGNCYQYVNRANQCIEGIPLCKMDETKQKEMISEAKFLRAYGYFKLLRNFRNIPFYPKSPKSKQEIFVKQASRDVVWKLIEEDLIAAVNSLPATRVGADIGRATKGAAAAFLGYAYLYQQKYPEAKAILKRIYDGEFASYDLLPMASYSQNWDGKNENNQESLFEVQMKYVTYTLTTNILQAEFCAWEEANASAWIYSEYISESDKDGNTDPRYYKSMISPAKDFTSPLGVYADISFNSGRNLILKHTTDQWVTSNRNQNNYPLMRYADVLLMLAEATNEVDGADAARIYINKVRQRANMADIPAGLTKEQFRLKIMHERAVELSFECRRWYDLVRWHEAGWINIKDILVAHNKQGASSFDEKYLYYPIPESEYETNPNLERSKQW